MSTRDTAAAPPQKSGPISLLLRPIRARLALAALCAAIGTMLTLAPLAGIAHIAQLALGEHAAAASTRDEIWRVAIASAVCLCWPA